MLKQRTITGVILVSVVVWALFGWSSLWFAVFLLVATFACAWEWSSLGNIKVTIERLAFSGIVTGMSAILICVNNVELLKLLVLVAVLIWIAIGMDLYVRPVVRVKDPQARRWGLLAIATFILIVSVWSLYWLRTSVSAAFILFIVALVAAADIGAYFTGRQFGVRKLAEKISGGKTIEGAIGGLVAAVVLSVLVVGYFSGEQIAWLSLFVICLFAALFSIVGDLYISRAKRSQGVKDSGKLLPGHGGVLDRFDGLLAAIPWMTFAMLWL